MPTSIFDTEFRNVLKLAKNSAHHANGPFPSPADWRDKWIYFLMVDRFNNKDASPLHQPFDDPNFDDFQGGKYSGIKDKLPYLKKLGVGAIWLSPVLKNLQFSKIYHGYGIHDFLHAEPRFADNPEKADDELRDLVDAAHAENIYIIFDIVLNHTGDVFAYDCDADDKTCNESHGSEARYSAATGPCGGATALVRPIFRAWNILPNPVRMRWSGRRNCRRTNSSGNRVRPGRHPMTPSVIFFPSSKCGRKTPNCKISLFVPINM
jgi:Alpha amylase, catalytic domain